jgi:hypothetical protein
VRRGAPWVVSPCRCLATAVAGLLGGVLPAELSWLLIDQRRLASGRWSLWTASQRSDVVAPAGNAGAPAMPSVAIRVHHWVSTPFGSHVRVRASSCPVSSHPVSSRPVSGQLVPSSGIRLSGRPVSARRRPAGWCPRVRPITSVSSASARRWPWRSRRCGGQSSQPGRIELPVVGGVPSGLVGRRVGLEGDGGEVVGRPVGERRSRTWPGQARAEAAVTLHR